MMKKILISALIVMSLGLVACGGGENSSHDSLMKGCQDSALGRVCW